MHTHSQSLVGFYGVPGSYKVYPQTRANEQVTSGIARAYMAVRSMHAREAICIEYEWIFLVREVQG
jgi:hypothetical protein